MLKPAGGTRPPNKLTYDGEQLREEEHHSLSVPPAVPPIMTVEV